MIGDQLLVIWLESEDGFNSNLCAQLVNPDGSICWEPEGRILISNTAFSHIQDADLEIINDQTFLVSTKMGDVYNQQIQKFDLQGQPLWQDGGIIPFNGASCEDQQLACHDGVISCYAMFIPDNDNFDIYGVFYDLEGNLWTGVPQTGFPICNLPHTQSYSELFQDSAGDNYLVWRDSRGEHYCDADPSLYMQKIEIPTVVISEDEIVTFSEISNYPNPFMRSTVLKCDLPRSKEDAEIVIYNIKGQKVRSLTTAANQVEWDCRNDNGKLAGAGVYFYRLMGEGITSRPGRMILLK